MWKGIFVALALAAGMAHAQQWEVGVSGGYGYASSLTVKSPAGSANAGFNNGGAFGVFGGNDTYNYWSGEARYLYRESSLNLSSGSTSLDFPAHTHLLTGAFLAHLRPRSAHIRPFIAFGGGLRIFDGTGHESASQPLGNIAALTHTQEVLPTADLGAGVKVNVSAHMRVRVEIRDYLGPPPSRVITAVPGGSISGWLNDIQGLVSVSYTW